MAVSRWRVLLRLSSLEIDVGKLIGGAALLLLSLFMLLGAAGAAVDASAGARFGAILLTVVLPAAGGAGLIASHVREKRRFSGSREQLRRQTLDAEILRLAAERGARLTVVELVTELAVSPEEATALLEGMHARELAELEITESGLLVYAFRDVRHLGQKPQARGILDA